MSAPVSIDSFGAKAFGVSVLVGRAWNAASGQMDSERISVSIQKDSQCLIVEGPQSEVAEALRMLAAVLERFGGKP